MEGSLKPWPLSSSILTVRGCRGLCGVEFRAVHGLKPPYRARQSGIVRAVDPPLRSEQGLVPGLLKEVEHALRDDEAADDVHLSVEYRGLDSYNRALG